MAARRLFAARRRRDEPVRGFSGAVAGTDFLLPIIASKVGPAQRCGILFCSFNTQNWKSPGSV